MKPVWMPLLAVLVGGCLLADGQNPRAPRPDRTPRPASPTLGEIESRAEGPRAGSAGVPGGRPAHLGVHPRSRQILHPVAHLRCSTLPSGPFWRQRDLQAEIQRMARRGFIPVAKTDPEARELQDHTWQPSGWRAYSFLVAPKGKLHVRLHHPNEGWFRLVMFNKWGQLEEGMLGNIIPTGNPEVRYTNPKDEFHFVYVLVDDPGWMSTKDNPYKLTIERSWDPKLARPGDLQPVDGVWAHLNREKLESDAR